MPRPRPERGDIEAHRTELPEGAVDWLDVDIERQHRERVETRLTPCRAPVVEGVHLPTLVQHAAVVGQREVIDPEQPRHGHVLEPLGFLLAPRRRVERVAIDEREGREPSARVSRVHLGDQLAAAGRIPRRRHDGSGRRRGVARAGGERGGEQGRREAKWIRHYGGRERYGAGNVAATRRWSAGRVGRPARL
jgi:hypothetical protein